MDCSYLVWFVVILSCCQSSASCVGARWMWKRNHAFENVSITQPVLSTSYVTSWTDCAKRCAGSAACKSLSYNYGGICRLHSVRFASTASYPSSPGWSHFYLAGGVCPLSEGFIFREDQQLCFKVHKTEKKFIESRDICNQSSSRLIVLDTNDKNTAVLDYVTEQGDVNAYTIGLTDKAQNGKFVWENGQAVDFTSWSAEGPNSGQGTDGCALLSLTERAWMYAPCDSLFAFICEKIL